ncbi:MAG: hypothetical protein LJE56_06775 [Acidiferrobacterales bacterium]|jgi:hypothetical protein|nr:hypothetical protein [Acidiferrobacterales bacterium]
MTEATEQNFDQIRARNDASLMPEIEAVRSGTAVHALEQFARAYLGMYMNIDVDLSPVDRVATLANPELVDAVLEGFGAAATTVPLPDAAEIASARARGNEHPMNFIALAGMDLLAERAMDEALALPEERLQSLLSFYFASTAELENRWYPQLVERRPETVAAALAIYWGILIDRGAAYLPGLLALLHEQRAAPIMATLSLTLLQRWKQCRLKLLVELLNVAFRYADEQDLRQLIETMLADQDGVNVKKTLLWMAAAFFISPDEHEQQLTDYCQASKEKILPLLDFSYRLLQPGPGNPVKMNAHALAVLLRIIGPKFPPKVVDGEADDSFSLKVLWLFHRLGEQPADTARREIKWLRSARVMRRCEAVLDEIEAGLA